MAHIVTFPESSQRCPWSSSAETLSVAREGQGGFAALLAALDMMLASIRLAWWDGSSLALSRGGLESLVGLEPGDATPPRLVPVEARLRGWTGEQA